MFCGISTVPQNMDVSCNINSVKKLWEVTAVWREAPLSSSWWILSLRSCLHPLWLRGPGAESALWGTLAAQPLTVAEGYKVCWKDSALSGSPPLVASPERGRSSATTCAWPTPPAAPAVLRIETKKKQTEEESLWDRTRSNLIFNLKCFSVPHGSIFEFLKAPSVAAPSGLLSSVMVVSFFFFSLYDLHLFILPFFPFFGLSSCFLHTVYQSH